MFPSAEQADTCPPIKPLPSAAASHANEALFAFWLNLPGMEKLCRAYAESELGQEVHSKMGNGLKIHTQMGPAPAAQEEAKGYKKAGRKTFLRAFDPSARAGDRRKIPAGDRLLRSTAVACALLLTVMALRNADLPWAQRAVAGIERVMTMKIDLDESLGRLHFVRELVPETALVFWNAGASARLKAPVEGDIEHAHSDLQPWRVYSCADGSAVCAAMDGEISRVEKGAMADYIVLITHDNGLETVYAYMTQVDIEPGERVYVGDVIGVTASGGGSRLYFAMRLDGAGVDPAEYE